MTLNNLISGQAIIAVFKSSTSQEFFFIYLEVELEVNLGGCLLFLGEIGCFEQMYCDWFVTSYHHVACTNIDTH